IPAVTECQTINGTDMTVGTLVVQYVNPTTGAVDVNPATFAGDNIKVIYRQSQSVNDNRYGTGATAATGWPSGHKFSDLTGSDEADLRFTDSKGNVVLDFQTDYISAATKMTWPAPYGTVSYPSGYGTLGATGGA